MLLPLLLACAILPDTADKAGPKDTAEVDSGETADDTGGLTQLDQLDVPLARWGVRPPNTLKAYPSAWDPYTGRLFVTGMQLPNILSIDLAVGHPDSGLTLPIEGHHSPLLVTDPERRLIYWIGRDWGGVVAVDLDTNEIVGRNDASYETDGDVSSNAILEAQVDPATGALWLLDVFNRQIIGWPSGSNGDSLLVDGPVTPAGLALSPAGDLLYYYDASDASVYTWRPSTGERAFFAKVASTPYVMMGVADDGSLVVAGTSVTVLETDGTVRWTVEAPGVPADVAVVGDTLALTSQDPIEAAGTESNGTVHLYDLADGSTMDVQARFGSERLSADPDGQRIFVSNSSDGSVSVIDAASWTKELDLSVANAPDTTVYDPVTNTRYVLDRLGGSKIHAWTGPQQVTDLDGGAWPTELAIDVERRRLYAPRHFTASIGIWDLDSGEELPEVVLDVLPSTSDTLGDFDYDPTSGLAAVVYPETGSVTLVDLVAGTQTWTHADEELAVGIGAGAGNAFVVLDVPNDRMYIFQKDPLVVKAISLSEGIPADGVHLDQAPMAYTLNAIFLDQADQRLYIAENVLTVPDLTPVRVDELPYRVLCHVDDALFAVHAAEDGAERLWKLDHETGEQLGSWELGITTGMRLESSCDADTRTLTVASLEQATVTLYQLP